MELNTIKTNILACLLISILTSCSVDKIKPINQLDESTVITNEVSANAVLNTLYNRHRDEAITRMAVAVGYYGVEQDRVFGVFGDAGFNTNNIIDNSQLLQDIYVKYYGIINNANFFIELLESGAAVGLSETRKNEMLAEARFFRAFQHFRLLKVFGEFYDTSSPYGIVTYITPVRNNNPVARSTVQETYDTIITDLEFAVANGPSGVSHLYVSATTAQALLAKVQLYMNDFTSAATNALAVIDNADGYALEPVYSDIFTNRWSSSEVLFAPYVDGFNEGTADTGFLFGSRSSAFTPSDTFKKIADVSDGSLDGSNDASGLPFGGYDKRFLYAYSAATGGTNEIGKYPFFTLSNVEGDIQGNTYYYLRMAELYLVYAEAEARRAGGDLNAALKRLNEVRDRAKMPFKKLTDKATLLADIRDDKMIELCSENGEPYYDLVRYDRLGDVDASNLKTTLTRAKHSLPIPAAALAGNSLLKPNPNQ